MYFYILAFHKKIHQKVSRNTYFPSFNYLQTPILLYTPHSGVFFCFLYTAPSQTALPHAQKA